MAGRSKADDILVCQTSLRYIAACIYFEKVYLCESWKLRRQRQAPGMEHEGWSKESGQRFLFKMHLRFVDSTKIELRLPSRTNQFIESFGIFLGEVSLHSSDAGRIHPADERNLGEIGSVTKLP